MIKSKYDPSLPTSEQACLLAAFGLARAANANKKGWVIPQAFGFISYKNNLCHSERRRA